MSKEEARMEFLGKNSDMKGMIMLMQVTSVEQR